MKKVSFLLLTILLVLVACGKTIEPSKVIKGFKEDNFEREFKVIYHKKKFRTQAAEEFLRFLKTKEVLTLLEK